MLKYLINACQGRLSTKPISSQLWIAILLCPALLTSVDMTSSYVRRSTLELDEFEIKNCNATDSWYCNRKSGFQSTSNPCTCKCSQSSYSYFVAEDKCKSNANIHGTCKFSMSIRNNNHHIDLRSFVLPYGRTRVYQCVNSLTCRDMVHRCTVSHHGSYYDGINGWTPLWKTANDVDFKYYSGDDRELAYIGENCAGTKYNGMLLHLNITCLDAQNNAVSSCLILKVADIFEFGNPYADEPEEKSTCPTTQPPVSNTSTTTPISTTITTPISTTITTPTVGTTTSSSHNHTTTEKSVSSSFPSSTSPSTTEDKNIVSSNPTTQPSTVPTTTDASTSSTSGVHSSSSVMTTTLQASVTNQSSTTQKTMTDRNTSGGSDPNENTVLLVVAIILSIFLIISCILVVYLCFKWRRSRKKQLRAQWSSHINPYAMHFIDVADGQAPPAIFLVENQLKSSPPSANTTDLIMTADQPYDEPADTFKPNTFRHIYAAVDKLRKKTKRSSNLSLDEGYTSTDEANYDYRRFAAFPRDLYDQPGDMVPIDEPDYRIPEDFIAQLPGGSPDVAAFGKRHKSKRLSKEPLYTEPDLYDECQAVPHKPERKGCVKHKTSRTAPRDPITGEPLYYEPDALVDGVSKKRKSKKVPPIPPRPDSLISQMSDTNTVVSTVSLMSNISGSTPGASESSDSADG